jgi:DNA-binding transcriptional MerR regulator
MLIGEVADRSGLPAKTIRYYESIGLVPAPARAPNGYRSYDDEILTRLAFIRAAHSSGLTLGEIRGVIAFRDRGETPCEHVRELIDQRTAEIDRRIAELQHLRADLTRLAQRARRLDPADCDPASVCHIIASRAG